MKVLVTGATGYVGVNFVHYLKETRHDPIALVRKSSKTELLPDSTTKYRGDVTDKESLDEAVEAGDAIVHLAATIPGSDTSQEGIKGVDWDLSESVNVNGTRNLLEKADEHGIDTVVHVSTTRAHPAVDDPQHESVYIRSKKLADQILVNEAWGFEYTVVHPTYVIGKRDYRLKRFTQYDMIRSNKLLCPPFYRPGELNILPMRDMTRSLRHYVENPADKQVILSGENITVKEYAKEICANSPGRSFVFSAPGHETILPFVADCVNRLGLMPYEGDQLRDYLSQKRGVVPAEIERQVPVDRTNWREAVRELVNWYESVGL